MQLMSVETVQRFTSVSSSCADTFTQWITPLIQCSVDNLLIKATPLFNQSLFQNSDDRRRGSGKEVSGVGNADLSNHFEKRMKIS